MSREFSKLSMTKGVYWYRGRFRATFDINIPEYLDSDEKFAHFGTHWYTKRYTL